MTGDDDESRGTGGMVDFTISLPDAQALARPRMTFGGVALYPTIVEKAAALGFRVGVYGTSGLVSRTA
jgi:hypothetical protein